MLKAFVTRPIPSDGLTMLKNHPGIDLTVREKDTPISLAELKKGVKDVDVVLSILTDKIGAEVMDAAGSNLKMIANYAVGFDNIDVVEAKKRKIIVTNAPAREVSEAVAEHVIALIFALTRRIVETDRFTRAGKYQAWGPQLFLGTDLMGKTLGIIGSGAIGSALAKRLHNGFDLKVVYHDIKRNEQFESAFGATYLSLPELLKTSDIISLHVPLLPSTRHLISTAELAMMKPTAFLINTARGPIVDEKALTQALMDNTIAGAGLDVFESEPLIDVDPTDTLELRKLDNVVLTPHTASATMSARQAMSRAAAANIIALADGTPPPHVLK